jgi:hypothetical protein
MVNDPTRRRGAGREPAARPAGSIPESAGLCARCVHARAIVSDRGSVFVLCEASRTDPSLDPYPRLPVLRCHGFAPIGGDAATPAPAADSSPGTP